MHLRILGYIVDFTLIDSPAICIFVVLFDLLERVVNRVWVLYHVCFSRVLLDELLQDEKIKGLVMFGVSLVFQFLIILTP